MIDYRDRYEPFNQTLIKMAQDTEMGPTRMILADAGFNIGDPAQWRLRKAMAGGGSLMDIGIYALNAARYLSGEEPVEVNAMMHTTPNDPRFTEVEENINFQLKFPSGILANCTSSYGVNLGRFRVFKPRGSFEVKSDHLLRRPGLLEQFAQPLVQVCAAKLRCGLVDAVTEKGVGEAVWARSREDSGERRREDVSRAVRASLRHEAAPRQERMRWKLRISAHVSMPLSA